MLVDQFALILFQLSFNDLFYQVDGNIHIVADLFGTDDIAFHRDRHFDLLTFLFYAERDMHLSLRRKVFLQFTDLLLYCSAKTRRYFNVLTDDHKFHSNPTFLYLNFFVIFSLMVFPKYTILTVYMSKKDSR